MVNGAMVGVVKSDGLVCAAVLELSEAVLLINLNDCYGSCELVVGLLFLDEKMGDGDGFGSSCDPYAPIAWTGVVAW